MRKEKIMLDTKEYDRMDDEEPSLYHLLKTPRRRDTRAIQQVQDSFGNIATLPKDVSSIFLNYLHQNFGPIDTDIDSFTGCRPTYSHWIPHLLSVWKNLSS